MSQRPDQGQKMLPFLLEIGSEEIPARFIPASMRALEASFRDALAEARLEIEGLRVEATPRRLVLRADGVAARQPDRELVVKGPPVSVAFDADGKPTPAGLGFARKAGIDLESCERDSDKRGEFLVARRLEKGRDGREVLADLIPGLVLGIPFRKVMRWGDLDIEYARPLQWILALLGGEVVPCTVGNLASGRTTRGHRTLAGDRTFTVADPGKYDGIMAEAGVVTDPGRRRALILEGLQEQLAAFSADAELVLDEQLLEEVVFLCEHPTPFLGSYDETFFSLPAAVITTALKAHQRYFTVRDRGAGKLMPRFASVRDGGSEFMDNVVAGNERVLRARLADALFYWNFDQQKSPDQRTEMLGAVTWLEGFGTVLDKSRRLVELSADLWSRHLGLGEPVPPALTRAALICKSDLVSEMIRDGKEFTKLEGFIGARYAELAGEDPDVVRAMEFHYAPRSATGELPPDDLSCCLSLADRIDTICGCWLAGFAPTGAKDPYALRRHVLAVIRILLDRSWRLDLRPVLAESLRRFAAYAGDRDPDQAARELGDFIRTRMEGHFIDGRGQVPEVVRAILPVRWFDPVAALAWSEALAEHRNREDFLQAASGFKRCRNILKGDLLPVSALDACLERWQEGGRGAAGEDFSRLGHETAEELRRQVADAAALAARAESENRLGDVFGVLSALGPIIDNFFTDVRVNDENEELRAVRMAFLKEIHGLFARYGDFQEMVATDN